MAVIENRATEEGDVIVIKTTVPIVGIVSLTSFLDTTSGETETTYFEKTFRYSRDGGMTFSDWMELTEINIQNVVIEKIDYFIIEYRYKRIGATGVLEFDSVQVDGTYEALSFNNYEQSPFSQFFTANDINVLGWAINVLEKLYKRGIIPAYITRNTGEDDRDYVAWWFTVTHFFAILVYFARQFENLSTKTPLMQEFVKGRGVYMHNDPDLDELYYIFTNYIEEIQRRGTTGIYRREAEIDGELLRLIEYVITDEFLFTFVNRGELGWCIGHSSPLYTGADGICNLIKGYEYTEEVEDLESYPLINSDFIENENQRIKIYNVPDGEIAGIGISESVISGGEGVYYYGDGIGAELIYPESLSDKCFVIDPTLNYEISFKVSKTVHWIQDLSFGVALFDKNGNAVWATRITDGSIANRFFEVQPLNQSNTEYWIRGVIYAYDTEIKPQDVLNVGFGQNLCFPAEACYLVPLILVENNTGMTLPEIVYIRDVKVRLANLWFSRGTLSARNFIIGYLKNSSTYYNNQQILRIIKEQLIPYNSYSLIKFL